MNKKQIKQKVLHTLQLYCNGNNKLYLPVPIKAIAKSIPNIRVIPYSRYMRDFNLTIEEMYKYSGTHDAYTDYDAYKRYYVIYYNDVDKQIMESKRYRWNIAHELGHIVLEHHNKKTRLFRSELSKQEYTLFEYEADWFAAYILVPYAILSKVTKNIDAYSIKLYCNISSYASKFRKKDFNKWKQNGFSFDDYDKTLLELFSHVKICKFCKAILKDDYDYCFVCGNKNHFLLYYQNDIIRKINMKYMKFENKNGHLIKCEICGNNEIVEDAEYCHICGSPVVNRCSANDYQQCYKATQKLIPINARYCPYCGSKTTFMENNILPGWGLENFIEEFC